SNGKNSYTDSLYDRPLVLVIGSEGKGMRPAILKQCDYNVKIPLHGKVSSLNASVSAGVLLFEIMRQKNNAER
ncbi:MAG: TrmH family RNA methyltransferase, partial [Bacteroidota bacterium]